jgi:transcriptional regulator with XRE-family HTH domain
MKGSIDMTLAESLKRIRRKYKMTQDDVALFLGVSRSGYTYYETGKSTPSVESLKKLAMMYDITVDELVGMPDRVSTKRAVSEENLAVKGADPLMYMKKEEQNLVMAFRLASRENKDKILREIISMVNDKDVE